MILLESIAQSLNYKWRHFFWATIYIIWILFCLSIPIAIFVVLYKMYNHTL